MVVVVIFGCVGREQIENKLIRPSGGPVSSPTRYMMEVPEEVLDRDCFNVGQSKQADRQTRFVRASSLGGRDEKGFPASKTSAKNDGRP